MEIIYFVLGVITVLSIGSIVIAIKVNSKWNVIKELQEAHQRDNDSAFKDINTEKNFNTERIYNSMNHGDEDIRKNLNEQIQNVFRQMDSRFDKLDSKIKK